LSNKKIPPKKIQLGDIIKDLAFKRTIRYYRGVRKRWWEEVVG